MIVKVKQKKNQLSGVNEFKVYLRGRFEDPNVIEGINYDE